MRRSDLQPTARHQQRRNDLRLFRQRRDRPPEQGLLREPALHAANFVNENFPGSVQTQVVAIDNIGNTAGFWVDNNDNNFGFIEWNGVFTSYTDPHTGKGTVNQLLGHQRQRHRGRLLRRREGRQPRLQLNQNTGKFTEIMPPGGNNAVAAGINNKGDVTGFLTAPRAERRRIPRCNKETFSDFSFPARRPRRRSA